MAVFVAAADDSEAGDQTGPFLFGGYVAPLRDWEDWFAPAWVQRVLGRPPRTVLPYFHMTEVASPTGRVKYGLTERDANARINEAVDVIRSMGTLHFMHSLMNGNHFRETTKSVRLVQQQSKQWGTYRFEPDYVAFLGFAYGVLHHVRAEWPDAEKVDFVVEKKPPVTHHLMDFHQDLASHLTNRGHSELVPLIGELIPGSKERVPLQAADICLWHLRKLESGEATREERRRLEDMAHGRLRAVMRIAPDYVEGLIERSRSEAVRPPLLGRRQ